MTATFIERSFTLTAKASEFSIPYDADRRGAMIGNAGNKAMMVRFGKKAEELAGIPLAAGAFMLLKGQDAPSNMISVWGTGYGCIYTW
jgi:hypothetical protein